MKKFKLFITSLLCMIVFLSCSAIANAKETGVIDLNKIIENYTEAQEIAADLKVKESELQKFVVEAQEKIKDAKSPVEKKNLEEKLGEQFNIKRKAFARQQSEKWQEIETKIFEKIEQLSKEKNFELVLNKQAVIIGGNDITDEVIKQLNEAYKKGEKKSDKDKGGFNFFK